MRLIRKYLLPMLEMLWGGGGRAGVLVAGPYRVEQTHVYAAGAEQSHVYAAGAELLHCE